MRRSAAAIVGTVLGTALMIGAKLGHPAPDDVAADAGADNTDVVEAAPSDGGQPVTVMVSGTPTTVQPSTKPGTTPRPTTSAASPRPGATTPGPTRTSAAPPPSPPAGPQYRDGTYTGPAVTEKYGQIKVTVVVSGGRITSATATCTNPCSGESASISNNAIPKLNSRTVAAQSASINTVSGATYTSGAYKQSLAAAVNAAKA